MVGNFLAVLNFNRLFLKPNKLICNYSLRFKLKVTFGHELRYEIQVLFNEISLKFHQTNWKCCQEQCKNNVNDVANELPSQIAVYTCLTFDIWTRWH